MWDTTKEITLETPWQIVDCTNPPITVYYFESVQSTNSLATEMAQNGCPEWTVIYANEQSKGKGRHSRRWHSPPGLGLYFSIVLRPSIDLNFLNLINLRTAWIIGQIFIQKLAGLGHFNIQLKWPNDVLINGKKICGILIESEIVKRHLNYLVIGIGINLNQTIEDFPRGIRSVATSYKIISKQTVDTQSLLTEILCTLNNKIETDLKNEFKQVITDYLDMMAYINDPAEIRLERRVIKGIIRGLDSFGQLIIEQNNHQKIISSGDLWIQKQGDDHGFTH